MLTNYTYQNTLVIYANSKKDKLGYGNYLRIVSVLPNLKFKFFFWVSDNKPIQLIKNSNFIQGAFELKSVKAKKLFKQQVSILNLFEKKKNTKNNKYFQNFLNNKQNIKESGNDLCKILLNIYKIKKYKLFHNNKKINFKNDLFINHIVPKEWKIKEYPIKKLKKLEQKLKSNNKNIKIIWQNKRDNMKSYVQKIKDAKLLLTIIGLGTHVGMLFNKRTIVLAGPTYFEDLKKYKNKIVFFPKKKCECQTKFLNKGIFCNLHNLKNYGCMNDIDENKLFNKLLVELKKKD